MAAGRSTSPPRTRSGATRGSAPTARSSRPMRSPSSTPSPPPASRAPSSTSPPPPAPRPSTPPCARPSSCAAPTRLSLADLLERYPRRKGAPIVRAALASGRFGAVRTRSTLELDFLAFLDARGLPLPEVNTFIEAGGRTYEADAAYRAAQLIVELDDLSSHGTETAFESDRLRDRALLLAGWRTIRVTSTSCAPTPTGSSATCGLFFGARCSSLARLRALRSFGARCSLPDRSPEPPPFAASPLPFPSG